MEAGSISRTPTLAPTGKVDVSRPKSSMKTIREPITVAVALKPPNLAVTSSGFGGASPLSPVSSKPSSGRALLCV